MTIHVQLGFDDASEPIAELRVHRFEYNAALNQPFLVTLGVTSTDSAVESKLVLGKQVHIVLEGEPWLRHLRGIVAGFCQRTAFGGAEGEST